MPQDIPVAVDLLADRTAVTQGGVIRLGVRFQIAPEWHIYWKNPGESGFATKIEWDLGEITTSSLETVYPAPVVFRGAGGVISYGYAGETLLFVTVRDVTLRPEAKKVKVRARVRWLMCREDECRDARKSLEMELPVGEAQPANRDIFDRFASLVPVEGIPENVRVDTTMTSTGLTAELRTEIPAKTLGIVKEDSGEARGLYFFPNPVKGWIVDTPKLDGKVSEVATKVGRLKVFAEQPTVSIQARRTSSTTTGPVEISGVLVQQFVQEDGTLTPVEIREFTLTAGK
ncbi:MAG: protein-disulfide reductase DsbD family protein [Candidatus Sumerlaea chitinivorans]|nr:protein-disulfide reductase DsbD family protein [Candidatus Sumerlaea chitinivorans]